MMAFTGYELFFLASFAVGVVGAIGSLVGHHAGTRAEDEQLR